MSPALELIPATSVPGISSISVSSDGLQSLGRDPSCELQLAHPAVSRRHACVEFRDGAWWVSDLGSRHGTMVNGHRLEKDGSERLCHGDLLGIPPLVFRVDLGEGLLGNVAATMVESAASESVERVSKRELGTLAAHRLDVLMNAASAIAEAADEPCLRAVVVDVLLAGTALGRAAILRPIDNQSDTLDVLEVRVPPGVEARAYSRTLITHALGGEVVRLNDEPDLRAAVSIVGAGVQQAICAPVLLDGVVQALLYVDAVQSGSGESDAAAFCGAIARLYGLAIANLKRAELEVRQAQLLVEMEAARNVQERLMPATAGVVGGVSYVMYSQPGRVVAGDLFGIDQVSDTAVTAYLGDVAGKGVGAGMLMASIQAALAMEVRGDAPPNEIVERLNAYVAAHSSGAEFATLFLIVIDHATLRATMVDAGHGYAALIRKGEISVLASDGGPPVGAVDGLPYAATEIDVLPGDRIVLYSDGVAEQQNPKGEEFGVERAFEALRGAANGEEDVAQLVTALRAFASSDHFADDVTLASVSITVQACD